MEPLDSISEKWHHSLSLVRRRERVKPVFFVSDIVCNWVIVSVSNLFLPELQRPLNSDLLHATVVWLSLDVRSWNINPFICLYLTEWILFTVVHSLPLVSDVKYLLRLLLKKGSCSFVRFATDWQLTRSTILDFEAYENKIG
jgi:hypothetical protein